MTTNEEIRSAVESAFRPLRCVAEIWDYDQKLRFRVFDADGRIVLTVPEEVLRTLQAESILRGLIESARSRVEAKGYKLDPWPIR